MNLRVEGARGFLDLSQELGRLLNFKPDVRALIPQLVKIVTDGNANDRMAGLDKNGKLLVGLAESTLRQRKGITLPFVEHGEDGSRAITNLVVIVDTGPGICTITMAWPGAEFLVYHAQGSDHLPVRDILGIPAYDLYLIDKLVVAESDRQIAQALASSSRIGRMFGRI